MPTTPLYRVIGCDAHLAIQSEPLRATPADCERALERGIGQEVDFGPGKRAKLTAKREIKTGTGERVHAFEVDSPLDPIGVFPAGAVPIKRWPKPSPVAGDLRTTLEKKHRAMAPKAARAISSSFDAEAIDVDLNGNGTSDRVVVSTLAQKIATGAAVTRVVWVSMDGGAPEVVEEFPVWKRSVAAIVVLGDHEEVVTMRTEPTGAEDPKIDYEYILWRGAPWRMVAELEEHDHSDR